jgi:hypothetical protein
MHIFVAQTTSATGDEVQIRFGYELNYDVPQRTLGPYWALNSGYVVYLEGARSGHCRILPK